ncbi:hypothetical protein Tco_0829253 [Tanacetum coccineum]
MGEGSAIPTDPHHTPNFIQPSPQPQKTQKPMKPKRKDTQVDTIAQTRFESVSKHSNDSLLARGNTLRSDKDRLKLDELCNDEPFLTNKVLDLEKEQRPYKQMRLPILKRRSRSLKKER